VIGLCDSFADVSMSMNNHPSGQRSALVLVALTREPRMRQYPGVLMLLKERPAISRSIQNRGYENTTELGRIPDLVR